MFLGLRVVVQGCLDFSLRVQGPEFIAYIYGSG